jgi:hypothetical protein
MSQRWPVGRDEESAQAGYLLTGGLHVAAICALILVGELKAAAVRVICQQEAQWG